MKYWIKNGITALTFGVIGGVAVLGVSSILEDNTGEKKTIYEPRNSEPVRFVNRMPNAVNASSPEARTDFTKAAKRSVDAVVHVKTRFMDQAYQDPLELFLYGERDRRREAVSAGSGVIISKEGYVVTNNHVVEKATETKVVLNNGKSYDAKIVGTDEATDIALLKVDPNGKELPTVQYGNSDKVEVGEWVLAVGNPFNLTSTVTAGIVSAKGRNIDLFRRDPRRNFFPVESFIQTDAAVNPGNSGGALVDAQGRLIGINTAIASNTGSYTGYSFAIPVNIVKKVVRDLIEYGVVQRAYIGVRIRNIDESLAKEHRLERRSGVFVSGLMEDGAAADAGIEENDIITKVGDARVNNVPELQGQITMYRPGDKVEITVIRDGEEQTIPVTLRNREGTTELVEKEDTKNVLTALGASFAPISEKTKRALGIPFGVKVQDLESGKLQKAGVREGFIILRMDRHRIDEVEDIEQMLKEKKGSGILIEGVYPNGMKAYYGIGG